LIVLLAEQKKYRWIRPDFCPCCGNKRLWGHGYVYRYFDEFTDPLPLKRWYCRDCRAVHTMRPTAFNTGFNSSREIQYASIQSKITSGKWLADISRQKQQYWFRGFKRQVSRISLNLDPQMALWAMLKSRYPFASHSIKHIEKIQVSDITHLTFAATDPKPPP
jgi:hypothetical protein